MHVEKHERATADLDEVGNEHHPALGQGVGKCADEGGEQDVGEDEKQLQQRGHPPGCVHVGKEGNGRDEKRVIGKRRKKLRCHDGVKAAIHSHV